MNKCRCFTRLPAGYPARTGRIRGAPGDSRPWRADATISRNQTPGSYVTGDVARGDQPGQAADREMTWTSTTSSESSSESQARTYRPRSRRTWARQTRTGPPAPRPAPLPRAGRRRGRRRHRRAEPGRDGQHPGRLAAPTGCPTHGGRLGGTATPAVHPSPGPARPERLQPGQAAVLSAVRQAAADRRRLLRQAGRRRRLRDLRQPVPPAHPGPVRRPQLCGLVQC